jgi:Ca2+-binding RTX toxin-like protein
VTADVSDAAGNPAVQATHGLTVDETPPTIAIGTLDGNDVLNLAKSGSPLAISGTTTGVEDGQHVTVQLNGQAYDAVVSGNAWTATVPAADLAHAQLPDGSYQVTADVSDAAGNPAVQATHGLTVDETAPAPGTLSFANFVDTGSADTPPVTQDKTFDLSLSGQETVAGTNTVYEVSTDGGQSWTATGVHQVNLADGTYQFHAATTDAAGNVATSNAITVTVDTHAPNAPVLALALGAGVANGVTAAEATAASGVVTISGEAGSDLAVTFSNGTHTLTEHLTGTGAPEAVTLTSANLATLGDGAIYVSATATDAAGNVSAEAGVTFTLDTADPVLAVTNITYDATTKLSTITGTSEDGATVVVSDNGALVGTVTANGSGVWSLTVNAPSNTLHKYTESSTGLAGHTSSSAGVAYYQNSANHTLSGTDNHNDVLIGRPNDVLTGGTGNDLFVFNSGFGKETITDFTQGADQIELSKSLFTAGMTNDQMASWVQAHTTVSGAGGADLVVQIDAQDTITLKGMGHSSLQTGDLIFV